MRYRPIRPAAVDGSTGFRRSCSTKSSAAAAAEFGFWATTGRQRQSTIARLIRLVLTPSLFIATPDLLPYGVYSARVRRPDRAPHGNEPLSPVPGSGRE